MEVIQLWYESATRSAAVDSVAVLVPGTVPSDPRRKSAPICASGCFETSLAAPSYSRVLLHTSGEDPRHA